MKTAILQVADTASDVKQVRYETIPGLPNHQVGTDGSVWTRSKYGPKRGEQRGEWRKMRPTPDPDGYLRVTICSNKIRYPPMGVHVLVLRTFVGECPSGMEACHNDGNPMNNNLDNLRWDTYSANAQDKHAHGTAQIGERNGNVVLTEEQVLDIREMSKRYGGQIAAARKYGVHRDTVRQIHTRKTWRHI